MKLGKYILGLALIAAGLTKARTSRHRSVWKLSVPGFVECPQCHAKMLRRKVCKSCGYLDGKQVIAIGEEA